MKTLNLKNKQGFTIIEVVLVLAIAGLIFLMVFIALPALQRSQRNQQYKRNVSMGVAMLQRYKANNRNQLPPTLNDDDDGYVTGKNNTDHTGHPLASYIDNAGLPDGISVEFWNWTPGNNINYFWTPPGRLLMIGNYQCRQNSGEIRNFPIEYIKGSVAVLTVLEEGAEGIVYCENLK